ncbi:zinc-dependent metalloprotease [Sphingoaurantiacus capsulatus]|uniref:Zinc-dependent metalloprotease n=1 Tax=Sphingoaurantiacus capsulatus TaxID=1771310 RepID=A0ABV7X7X9_9SPHN
MLKRLAVAATALSIVLAAPALAKDDKPGDPMKGTVARDGLLPVNVDAKGGRILLSLPKADADGISGRYLYMASLKTGLGSAPIGLDRAQPGPAQMLVFRRLGKKVAIELENPRFRATGAGASELAAARDAFAYSTLWLGDAIDLPGGGLAVDIAPFLARDTKGIAAQLKDGGEKGYKLVADLSAADPSAVKVFPDNIEFEARQTYVSDEPGDEVSNIAPDPRSIGIVVRHSLVRLPEAGYRPRRFDPRGGSFATQVLDFASPLGSSIVYELANRFRLEKTDPTAARSTVKKPIVFYIDNGAPEPIRTALLEGASWWKTAFEAAGLIDAYRVEILPEGIDPLDVRYNVVNWVNRATRGWSYGYAVTDPRTGEILKGTVLLGSLRVRQDMLIYEGLVGADKVGTGGPNDPAQVALARIRQLSAHEVGHALGILHNFAGSTQDRASVMDYPAPRVGLVNGVPDLSDAYGVGVGKWDNYAVDWLYGDPAGGDLDAAARAKADAATRAGLRFVGDENSRSVGSSQPWGGLWDDGADAAVELNRVMAVRRAAVDRFGMSALHPAEPASNLRRKLVPIWLMHRYQVEAAAKYVGGVESTYAVKGDGDGVARATPADDQQRALTALFATLEPAALDIPERLVPLLSAGWSGSEDRQFEIEIFPTAGSTVFDPLTATDAAAQQTLNALLAPERLNRMADQNRRNGNLPGAREVVDRVVGLALLPAGTRRLEEVRRRIGTRSALALAATQRDQKLSPGVAAVIDQRLADFARQLAGRQGMNPDERAWSLSLSRLLLDREALDAVLKDEKREPKIPPGMPIG